MPVFLTKSFLKDVQSSGRLLDGLAWFDSRSPQQQASIEPLPNLDSWECILEEVLDTDHEPPYYGRHIKELLARGYQREDIQEMRMIAWETAGWYNFEMMAWDWCHLSESDMLIGLEDRRKQGNIDQTRYDQLRAKIEHYRKPPSPTVSTSQRRESTTGG
ncbi:MAG: hypothetical protein AAFX93_09450 [Verrucomicrobiota bacterium]